jgi:signal transduction histidine kinase
MNRLSVRIKVTAVFTVVMALVLTGLGVFLYTRLESDLDRSINQDLQARSADLGSLIRNFDRGLGESVRTILRRGGAESVAQVLTPSGRRFDAKAQPRGAPLLSPAESTGAAARPVFLERDGAPGLASQPVRLYARGITFEHHPLVVVTGASLSDRNEALANLETLLLIGGPIALVLASLVAYGAVAAALRPVEAMRARAAAISSADASQRLPLPPAQDELRRLGETLNEMLGRLQGAIERERAFVDDASHELRTPLALHRAELELALRYSETPEELREAIGSAMQEADRIARLAEDLLVLARTDVGQLAATARPVAVGSLFEAVRTRLEPAVRRAGRTLAVTGDGDAAVLADEGTMEQALGGLVENSLRHGDGSIRLWSERSGRVARLHVSDDGPGFPPDFLPRAFERFGRADPARGGAGAGLGLAIVKALAEAYGGSAHAENGAQGGADVWIELPLAA